MAALCMTLGLADIRRGARSHSGANLQEFSKLAEFCRYQRGLPGKSLTTCVWMRHGRHSGTSLWDFVGDKVWAYTDRGVAGAFLRCRWCTLRIKRALRLSFRTNQHAEYVLQCAVTLSVFWTGYKAHQCCCEFAQSLQVMRSSYFTHMRGYVYRPRRRDRISSQTWAAEALPGRDAW